MAQRDITVLKDVALITCVVQRGSAEPIISAAREAGAQGATVNYGKEWEYESDSEYWELLLKLKRK